MGTLDTGRDAVDQAVRITGKAFYQGAINASEALYGAVVDAAQKQGLDPRYVMYVILTQPRSWRGSVGRNAEPLGIARELYIAGEHQPPKGMSMPPGDQEHDVDAAVAEVAQWASSEFVEILTNTFVAVAREGAKMVRKSLEQQYEKPASEKQARHVLVRELMLRVKDHTFWFRDSVTLHRMLRLMFKLT